MTNNDNDKPFRYAYPHPAVAADLCIFSIREGRSLSVLLVRRGGEPFKGRWALPGGFLRAGEETIEACARRELREETGTEAAWLTQFGVYSDPARDPREHVVSIAFTALVKSDDPPPDAGTDADEAAWMTVDEALAADLAFDHSRILAEGRRALAQAIGGKPILIHVMPDEFTLWELQKAYEAVHGHTLDKANFRRTLGPDWLVDTGKLLRGKQRPARIFRMNPELMGG